MKIHPVGDGLVYEKRQTGMTKPVAIFHNSVNVPNNEILCSYRFCVWAV